MYSFILSPKFKRVSLNEIPEFPFWGLNICVHFDLWDSKEMENINKLKNNISWQKYWYSQNPIRETRVLKLVFITIPCLKFWALSYVLGSVFTIHLVWRSTYCSTFSSLKYAVHVITNLQRTTRKFTMVLDALLQCSA